VHHDPPEVTWPLPELDVGVEVGELSPLDELLGELLDVPELELECRVLLDAELEDVPVVEAVAAPGRTNATPPAAIRLAAVAETVAARSRDRPRSRAAGPDVVWLRWLMAASVTFRSRRVLWAHSHPAMSASGRATRHRARTLGRFMRIGGPQPSLPARRPSHRSHRPHAPLSRRVPLLAPLGANCIDGASMQFLQHRWRIDVVGDSGPAVLDILALLQAAS
jgi:hypothetical protein